MSPMCIERSRVVGVDVKSSQILLVVGGMCRDAMMTSSSRQILDSTDHSHHFPAWANFLSSSLFPLDWQFLLIIKSLVNSSLSPFLIHSFITSIIQHVNVFIYVPFPPSL